MERCEECKKFISKLQFIETIAIEFTGTGQSKKGTEDC